jgi:hypothetical protein
MFLEPCQKPQTIHRYPLHYYKNRFLKLDFLIKIPKMTRVKKKPPYQFRQIDLDPAIVMKVVFLTNKI